MDIAIEYPLYYPLRPATLKQFASTKLALDLCRRKGFNFANLIVTCPREEFSCEEMLQVVLPLSIRDVIDKRICSIRKELEKLFDNFNKLSIIANLKENALECIDCITYGPDSTLNLEATVRNMFKSDNFNVFEKYMIACVYRFDKDIRKFWPLVFDHLFKNMADSRRCPIMCYSSTRSPLAVRSTATTDLSSLEFHFYSLMDCSNWTGLEYFLNCINGTEEQCRVLSRTLEACSFKNIKYVLPKLNKVQFDHLLERYPVCIIRTLALEEGYFEYVLKVWFLVKESINEFYFCSLLTELVSSFYIRDNRWNCDQVSQIKEVLNEIWISAPDRLKNAFFADISRLFDLLNMPITDNTIKTEDFDLDVNFVSQLLAGMPIELRTSVWIEHWIVFSIFFNLEYFEKLMRFCLGNGIEEFVKSNMLNYKVSKTYVKFLFKRQLYGDIIEYINFCSIFCNDGLVREFKRQTRLHIPSNLKGSKFDKLIELDPFVVRISINDDEADEIKETIFSSNDVQRLIVSKLENGFPNEVISVTERFLGTKRSMRERQIFRDHWVDFLTAADDVDVGPRWNEFLSWWKGNEDGWPMFKQFLPVDEVFEKLLQEAVPKLTLWLGPMEQKRIESVPSSAGKLDEFGPVDDFLIWYFGTETEVRNYKWSKISSYQSMATLKNLLSINNECIVNDALRWFFHDDLMEVGNFKDSYERNMRLYVNKLLN